MTTIVYTCITDDYDWLLPPLFTSEDIRYICFTNRPEIKVRGWEVRPLPVTRDSQSPNMAARRCKFLPWDYLPPHDWSIWIDANIRILRDPRPLLEHAAAGNIQLLVPAHTQRTEVGQELEACVLNGKIRTSAVRKAEERLVYYSDSGFRNQVLLAETGILLRRGKASGLREAMELWWKGLHYFDGRDQISLPYVAWKLELPIDFLTVSVWRPNEYFTIVAEHKARHTLIPSYLNARRFHGKGWMRAYQTVVLTYRVARKLSGGRTPAPPY